MQAVRFYGGILSLFKVYSDGRIGATLTTLSMGQALWQQGCSHLLSWTK